MKYFSDFKEYRIHILIFTFAGSNTEAQAFLSRGGVTKQLENNLTKQTCKEPLPNVNLPLVEQ
jgi:hypothetical protein